MQQELQRKIIQLKNERGICVLAHSYMSDEICEIADFTGDSYALALKAKQTKQKTVIMCGVRFMAETVKMLAPEKRVLLANPNAGCPMAEQMDKSFILKIKSENPEYAVVAYVNTTAQLKTVADVCVTSSCAVKVCRNMPEQNIIFIPDINLGTYVKNKVPEKNFMLLNGGCPWHAAMTKEDFFAAKSAHPDALFLAHPECPPHITALADFVGSTSGIMDYAENSSASEFIIGTENSIVSHLRLKCPHKKFYPLSDKLVCKDMRITTLNDVLNCITGCGGEEIVLDEDTRVKAVRCIERMIELGG